MKTYPLNERLKDKPLMPLRPFWEKWYLSLLCPIRHATSVITGWESGTVENKERERERERVREGEREGGKRMTS